MALFAGAGSLPVYVAETAIQKNISVVPYMIGHDNKTLKKVCGHAGYKLVPGLLNRTLTLLNKENITAAVFAGKVNKWLLLKDPRLDEMALKAIKSLSRLNDDAVMLWLINALAHHGINVLPQSLFLQSFLLPAGQMTRTVLSAQQRKDASYGFELAKEMGRLDIGQSVVVHEGMAIAIEAIEGTDHCIKRAGKLAGKKGGVLVKVAKPNQDNRFDIPTVGLQTLKCMKRAGLKALVTEADQTLYVDSPAMRAFAERHNLAIESMAAATATDNTA
ncbi:MAG: UDP-2,3-diacylglucosamine diphosphatase LpxI [Cyanobacteria bacterium P01_H01_bin.74]